jgi:hypothetical protein
MAPAREYVVPRQLNLDLAKRQICGGKWLS